MRPEGAPNLRGGRGREGEGERERRRTARQKSDSVRWRALSRVILYLVKKGFGLHTTEARGGPRPARGDGGGRGAGRRLRSTPREILSRGVTALTVLEH